MLLKSSLKVAAAQQRHLIHSFHTDSCVRQTMMKPPLKLNDTDTHYDKLGLATDASPKDIKRKFKQMSKVFHPDVVSGNLDEQERKLNSDNYIQLVESYEVLSDDKKRLEYDIKIRKSVRKSPQSSYYGEPPRGFGSYAKASTMNFSRTRVHYGHKYEAPKSGTVFHGKPNDTSSDGVPHFDYHGHLNRHLKMEERMLNKKIQQMTQGTTKGFFDLKQAQDFMQGNTRYQNIYRHAQKKKE